MGENPVPKGHPAHKVWEEATAAALEEVYRLNSEMLAEQPNSDDLPDWRHKLVFLKYQIWAKRNLAIVQNQKDARGYEQWLDNYMQSWIDTLTARSGPPTPIFKAQLVGACNHWKGNAWAQVRTFGLRAESGLQHPLATGSAGANSESDRIKESRGASTGKSDHAEPVRLETIHVKEAAEGAMGSPPSWKELRADFLEQAIEHADLRAVWRWMYEDADESADPPAPKGHWAFEGGSPGSQHLFRVIAGKAGARLSIPSDAEPWRFWLDRMRAESYARDLPPRRVSMQEMRNLDESFRPLPPGFKTQHIEHVFRASADFCFARSLAEVNIASPSPATEKAEGGQRPGLRPSAAVDSAGADAVAERAAKRQLVVKPILKRKRWKRGRLATEAAVGKNSVYDYLDGTRAKITDENRAAIAEALGLKPEELPD